MKNLKRLMVALLTLVLSFSAVSAVSAAGNGSITVEGATEGKTYEIYKIFDLTYSGTNVAYTIDSNWVSFFNGDGAKYISDTNTGGLNPITIGNTTKYINITESNKVKFSEAALAYIAKNNLAANKTQTAGEGETTVQFTGLDLGYYLVYPKGATDIKKGESTICTLTSTMPSITVNVKATYPTITKTADDESVDAGQIVEFTIKGQVPTTTGYNKYTYIISDTWTGGLEFVSEEFDFTVKFGPEGSQTKIEVTPNYTYADEAKTIVNGFTLEFDMTKYQNYKGQEIIVTYNLKVTEDAITTTTNNSATLTYSNNPKDAEDKEVTPPVIVKLYSSEIIVDKYEDGSESTKLSGAQFILSKVNEDRETVYYRALDADGKLMTSTDTTSIYTTTGVDKVEWTTDKDAATVLTTNAEGKVEFKGIENGNYSLIETKAPEGYNLLPEPKEITVQPKEEATTKSVSLTEKVANSTGTRLPTTGGFGTTLFITIGSLLALASAIILITNKRISKEF